MASYKKFFWIFLLLLFTSAQLVTPKSLKSKKHKNSRCAKCPPGFRVVYLCTKETNTKCAPCSLGTYSKRYSRKSVCHRCTECSTGMFPLLPCNKYNDVYCESCLSPKAVTNPEIWKSKAYVKNCQFHNGYQSEEMPDDTDPTYRYNTEKDRLDDLETSRKDREYAALNTVTAIIEETSKSLKNTQSNQKKFELSSNKNSTKMQQSATTKKYDTAMMSEQPKMHFGETNKTVAKLAASGRSLAAKENEPAEMGIHNYLIIFISLAAALMVCALMVIVSRKRKAIKKCLMPNKVNRNHSNPTGDLRIGRRLVKAMPYTTVSFNENSSSDSSHRQKHPKLVRQNQKAQKQELLIPTIIITDFDKPTSRPSWIETNNIRVDAIVRDSSDIIINDLSKRDSLDSGSSNDTL